MSFIDKLKALLSPPPPAPPSALDPKAQERADFLKQNAVRSTRGWMECLVTVFSLIGATIIAIVSITAFTPLSFNPLWGLAGAGTSILVIIYVGILGFRNTPIGTHSVPIFLGERSHHFKLSEGLIWYWPTPIGRLDTIPTAKRIIEQPASEATALNDILVVGDLSSEVTIEDPFKYVVIQDVPDDSEAGFASGAEILYQKTLEGKYREICSQINAELIPHAKDIISDILLYGILASETREITKQGVPSVVILQNLELEGMWIYALRELGIKVNFIRIGKIKLPTEITDARAQAQVEEAQQTSQLKEVETLKKAVAELRIIFPNLPDQQLMNMALVSLGKQVTFLNITGGASSLENAGALAGGILNNQNPNGGSSNG